MDTAADMHPSGTGCPRPQDARALHRAAQACTLTPNIARSRSARARMDGGRGCP